MTNVIHLRAKNQQSANLEPCENCLEVLKIFSGNFGCLDAIRTRE